MNMTGIEMQKEKEKRKREKKESLLQDLEDKQFTLLFKENKIKLTINVLHISH